MTDYSSVAFDFGYMRKPVIYYQFDDIKYYKNHYPKGYYKYSDDGFGEVIYGENELLRKLKYITKNTQKNKYLDRCNKFFRLYDIKNSLRIYKSIKEI